MRTVRKAYHYRWKALRVNQRADKLKRTKLRRTLGQQKGGFVGAAASALGDYTAKYSLDYSNYKMDANGYVHPTHGLKEWKEHVANDPDTVKSVVM